MDERGRKMHILFIADGDNKYGAQNSLFQLVENLKKIDSDMEISIALTLHSDTEDKFEKIGCKVYKIPYMPFYHGIPDGKFKFVIKYIVRGMEYLLGRIVALRCLEKRLDVKKVDIIHSNSSREDFGALIAKKYKIPFIWHIREFGDLDYACYSYRKNYIQLMNETATEFIAISKAVCKHWIKKGIKKEKIVQIYNGVALNSVVKTKYPKPKDKIHFVMMGALNETKGQHYLIEAISLLPEDMKKRIIVDFAGDGNKQYTEMLSTLVESSGLSQQIRFLGYQKDFYRQLAKYDCGFMCSKSEGFGRVTVEYMMAGLVVVASDTGANPELINNGINGLLYEQGNVNDLKEKIVYLLNNIEEIEEMAKYAQDYARENFSSERNAREIYKEYVKLFTREN